MSRTSTLNLILILCLTVFISACSSVRLFGSSKPSSGKSTNATKKGGGYYSNDGPDDVPPENLDAIPNAVPRIEPLATGTMKPYNVFGVSYTPYTSLQTYKKQGLASWYGKKFHGEKTSNGETYDMYAMTAAHTILPIPSYVRVTRVATGKNIIVRVNDRGPFHSDRIIDLSYTAAYKLGIIGPGSAEVIVEQLLPDDIARINQQNTNVVINTPSRAPTIEISELTRLSTASDGHYIQVGAFSDVRNAEQLIAQIKRNEPTWQTNFLIVDSNQLKRVHIGPYPSRESAEVAARQLLASNQISNFIIIKN